MKLRKVSPSKIKIPEVRVTGVFDEETKALLRDSMAGMGQVAPIVCIEVDGEITLVDGYNRLEVARRENWETVDVAIAEGDMVDVMTRNLLLDHIRGKHTPGQMLKVIEALTKTYGLDSDKIAEKTGLKRDYIERFQIIAQTTPAVRLALDEERIKLGHAAALAKIKDPIRQETVLQQALLYNWQVKELDAFVDQVLTEVSGPPPAQVQQGPQVPVTVKCAYCGEDHVPGDIRNPNTCLGCFTVLTESIIRSRQALAEEQANAQKQDSPPK